MHELNEYWYFSWWTIFDELDKLAHKEAKRIIGNCMTSDRTIKFLSPMNLSFDKYIKQIVIIKQTKKIVIIEILIEWVVLGIFTFVKI